MERGQSVFCGFDDDDDDDVRRSEMIGHMCAAKALLVDTKALVPWGKE